MYVEIHFLLTYEWYNLTDFVGVSCKQVTKKKRLTFKEEFVNKFMKMVSLHYILSLV